MIKNLPHHKDRYVPSDEEKIVKWIEGWLVEILKHKHLLGLTDPSGLAYDILEQFESLYRRVVSKGKLKDSKGVFDEETRKQIFNLF